MPIIRDPNKPIMLEVEMLKDNNLSNEAIGVYAKILYLERENLSTTTDALKDFFKDQHHLDSIFNELIQKGYLKEEKEAE